ncbi:sel1 repeat family protein [Catenovulum sp. SM1970]|uniref:tetratricopeptide repeat protein n=1 Tax=Marinifaba aquimaris TaxID=2741323 RepID=UPI001573FD01|nr:tetratricopeptide repeat protein [Marinifaba aquimaris]NTS77036.1 sel1 repeat family protein [Marinifaba aquimaris]
MKPFKILSLVACMLAFSPSSIAQPTLSAADLAHFEEKAKLDDKIAYQLGHIYTFGLQGVDKDLTKAVHYLTEVVEPYYARENPVVAEASFLLAALNSGFEGHKVDEKASLKYFKYAADAGHKEAPYRYAMLTKDDAEYKKYLEIAANYNQLPAILDLVSALYQGKRIKPNDKALVKWLRKAADLGHANAQALLAGMYFNGDLVYQDYQRAHDYFVKAAIQDHPQAQAQLGLIYMMGLGRDADLAKARKWLEAAYDQGDMTAGENYAATLLDHQDKKMKQKGINILKQVAKQGSKSAALKLVDIYQAAEIVEADPSELAKWKKVYDNTTEEQGQIIGQNKQTHGVSDTVYKTSPEAIKAFENGLKALESAQYLKAIELFEQGARADLPVAQLNLAIANIKHAQQAQDEAFLYQAYAWVKIANDNQQQGADKLLADIEGFFGSKELEQAQKTYQSIKQTLK